MSLHRTAPKAKSVPVLTQQKKGHNTICHGINITCGSLFAHLCCFFLVLLVDGFSLLIQPQHRHTRLQDMLRVRPVWFGLIAGVLCVRPGELYLIPTFIINSSLQQAGCRLELLSGGCKSARRCKQSFIRELF